MTVHVAGTIHGHPGADAVRVEAGRIVEIGLATAMDGPVVDHGTAAMLPGLRDSHLHPLGLAVHGDRLDLSDAVTIHDVVDRIARQARSSPEPAPIIAVGLDDEKLADGRLPTAQDLDGVATGAPVLIYRHCSHVASANTAALRAAGIGVDTADPPGGRFQRDTSGRLTGVLEEAAITPVAAALADRALAPDPDRIRGVLARLRKRGLVAVDAMVASGPSMWCVGDGELATITALGSESPLAIDVFVICDTPEELGEAALRLGEAGPHVRFAGWKGFADGSLGARTAALRSPYSDDPSTSGMPIDRGMSMMAETAAALGGQAAIHAIGDRAADAVIAVAERLSPGTVRIEHASVVDAEQIEAMAAAGMIASVQPSFVASDGPWVERRLGSERLPWTYPFASMRSAGLALRGGSDAPIESADPFVGMQDACSARTEALSGRDAVDLYADQPLAVGSPATFVICTKDPSDVAVDEIAEIGVTEVWIEDRRVE